MYKVLAVAIHDINLPGTKFEPGASRVEISLSLSQTCSICRLFVYCHI
jgi:hypothetical protein